MRTLKLTHDEVFLIETALEYVYNKKLDIVSNNRKLLSKDAVAEILKKANEYVELSDGIRNGEKDD